MNVTNIWSSKCGRKIGVIGLVCMLPSWVMILKSPKLICFFEILADASKSKSAEVIYVHLCIVYYDVLFRRY